MESFLIAVASMAVVLGIMILVHEFGHYAAAKWFGVRVDVFSIGFGKRLTGFRSGDTDYRISALPLGGYVKMAGENPLASFCDRHRGPGDEHRFGHCPSNRRVHGAFRATCLFRPARRSGMGAREL